MSATSPVASAGEVNAAVDKVEEAQARVNELDAQLATDLAEFGAGLSPDQQQEYIANFYARNNYDAAKQELEAAALSLKQALDNGGFDTLLNEATPQDGVHTSETGTAETHLYEALKALAQTSQAETALKYTNFLIDNNDPRRTSSGFQLSSFSQSNLQSLETDIVAPATARLAGQYLAEADGNNEAAFRRLVEFIEPLNSVREVVVGGGDSQRAWDNFKIDLFRMTQGEAGALTKIADDWEARGRAGRTLVGVGLLFNAAIFGDAVTQPNSEFDTVAKAFAQGTRDGLTLFSGAAATAVRRAQGDGAPLPGSVRLAQKLLPGLGLVANFASLTAHGRDLREDPDAGLVVSVIGDAFGVAGSVLEVVPGGAILGTPVSTVGELVSSAGEVFSHFIKGDEDKLRKREMLLSLSGENALDSLVVDAYLSGGRERLEHLSQCLGLSPHQIQALAYKYPVSLFSAQAGVNALVDFAEAMGTSGESAYGLLMGVGDSQDPGLAHAQMSHFLDYLENRRAVFERAPDQFVLFLERDIEVARGQNGSNLIPQECIAAFERLLERLRS